MKIWYCVINGGDGSAYPAFFRRKGDAEAREEHEKSSCGEGWAEPSVSYLEVDKDVDFKQDYIGEDKDYNEIYPN